MKNSERFLHWWQNVVKGNHISKNTMFKIILKLDNIEEKSLKEVEF
jgi:hypothetical protein